MISGVNSIAPTKSGNISDFEEAQRKGIEGHIERLQGDQQSPVKSLEGLHNYVRELEDRVHELESNVAEEDIPPLTTQTPLVLLDADEIDLTVIVAKVNELITRLS